MHFVLKVKLVEDSKCKDKSLSTQFHGTFENIHHLHIRRHIKLWIKIVSRCHTFKDSHLRLYYTAALSVAVLYDGDCCKLWVSGRILIERGQLIRWSWKQTFTKFEFSRPRRMLLIQFHVYLSCLGACLD